ncbi:hypothetical protein SOPP22_16250 [Shewanella sp. OPT22]|nr:hypothetical protein SOPP22_16250 [Shewanella sp. OPT22]
MGCSPLVIATINNDSRLVKALIDKGADVNIKGMNGQTPLEYATFMNTELLGLVAPRKFVISPDIVKLLSR